MMTSRFFAVALAVALLTFINTAYAPPPGACTPWPECKNDGGGDPGGELFFDARLIGNGSEFPALPTEFVCGTNGPVVVIKEEEFDLGTGPLGTGEVENFLPDQVFGIGTAVVTEQDSEGFWVNLMFQKQDGPGGVNRVLLPGTGLFCGDNNDGKTLHAPIRMLIDRNPIPPCGEVNCVTGYTINVDLTSRKSGSCPPVMFESPVALSSTAATTFELFHRCMLERNGNNAPMGTTSWGRLILTPP